jgi:hypothetical protein
MPTHRPPPTVTPADVESDIKAHFDALEKPGGALYVLAVEAAERRGRDRLLRWLGRAAWAVVLLALGWGFNHYSVQRNEETRHMGRQDTAKIEAKLKQVEEVTKALAPEAFTTKAAK